MSILSISEVNVAEYVSVDGQVMKVVREVVDIEVLERERAQLEAEMIEDPPTDAELLAWAQDFYPGYRRDDAQIRERIKQIDEILAVAKEKR